MKFSFIHSIKWSIFIFAVTFILAVAISVVSAVMLEEADWGLGMIVVIIIIMIGIFFDIMGLASASANEMPFHAMASEKVKGSRHAIGIVRNADRFSNFCNDVVGDICGVISGTAAAGVVFMLLSSLGMRGGFVETAIGVLFAGLVSALTVGGKAMGKSFAIHYSTEIVLWIGKFFYFLEKRFKITIFTGRKSRLNGKRGNKRAAGKR